MNKRSPELSKTLKRRLGCKDIECLKHFTFTRQAKRKLSRQPPSWEFAGRCTRCPKLITLSDAMMRSAEQCIGKVDVTVVFSDYDAMFSKE